jgi:hypothetical protein
MNEYVSSLHPSIRFSRFVFRLAAFVGLVEIVPLYFSEGVINRVQPPAITQGTRFLEVGPEREVARYTGLDKITGWVNSGAPLPK